MKIDPGSLASAIKKVTPEPNPTASKSVPNGKEIDVAFGKLGGDIDIPTDDAFGKWVQGRLDINLNLAARASDLQDGLSKIGDDIQSITKGKNWDFTLNADNKLVILSDELSDKEMQQLGELLDREGIDTKLRKLRDVAIEGFNNLAEASEVYPGAKLPVSEGFEFNETVFAETFRGSDFLKDAQSNPQDFEEEISGQKHLWGASFSLMKQISNHAENQQLATTGYIVDSLL